MSKLRRIFCSLTLSFLFLLVPFNAYASEIDSQEFSVSFLSEDLDPKFVITCAHDPVITYLRRSPVQIDVKVTNNLIELYGIKCSDIMTYTLFVEIYKADGSLDVLSSKRTGALGRFQSEIWNIGGQPGEKMRCQLVTTVHHQTKVTEWKEIYFIS